MKKVKFLSAAILLALSIFGTPNGGDADAFGEEKGKKETIQLCSPQAFGDFDSSLTDGASRDDVFRLTDDGVLEINGSKFGFLATKKRYKNFTVRGEYAIDSAATNAGFLVRVTDPSETFLPRCVEIQIMSGESADLYGFHGLKIAGPPSRFESAQGHEFAGDYSQVHAFRQVENRIGEWNRIEIVCFEDWVTVRINGLIVNWAYDVENAAGRVAFQSEGGPVRWRSVTLTEEE